MSHGKLRTLASPCVLLGVLATLAIASSAEAATHLTLSKTLRKAAGGSQALIYTVKASNRGARAARNVRVSNAMPAGTSFVNASRGCSLNAARTTVTCNLGTIPGRGSVVITIVLRPAGSNGPTVTTGAGGLGGSTATGGTTTVTSSNAGGATVTTAALAPACTRTITGTVNGAIIVEPGETVCIVDATVRGSVIVHAGGALSVSNSRILGSIISNGALFVSICGSPSSPYTPAFETTAGSINIRNTTGPVVVGAASGCSPNQIGGALSLTSNSGGTTVVGNTVGGGTIARGNLNGLFISGNNINGSLSCFANVPPPTNGGVTNNVVGAKIGQCAGL